MPPLLDGRSALDIATNRYSVIRTMISLAGEARRSWSLGDTQRKGMHYQPNRPFALVRSRRKTEYYAVRTESKDNTSAHAEKTPSNLSVYRVVQGSIWTARLGNPQTDQPVFLEDPTPCFDLFY
jgi:hypothetical protein